jgi:protease I
MAKLDGKQVAMIATDGVEQVELTGPRDALRAEGATVTLIGVSTDDIQGMNHHDKGDRLAVDATIDAVKPEKFDALVLPGGVANPDTLRTNKQVVAFVRAFAQAGKPIAAICHGPWTLIEADAVRGKKLTSWPSLQTDLRNAGATWEDREVVRDGTLVTSRKPDDIPAFNRELIALITEVGASRKAA